MSTLAISLLLHTLLLLSPLKNKRKTKLVIQMGRRLKQFPRNKQRMYIKDLI